MNTLRKTLTGLAILITIMGVGFSGTVLADTATAAVQLKQIVPTQETDSLCYVQVLTYISDPSNPAHNFTISATRNGSPVAKPGNFSATHGASWTVTETRNRPNDYFLKTVNGVQTKVASVTFKGTAPNDSSCDNRSPLVKPIRQSLSAGQTIFVDVFNPQNPLATDPDGDPMQILQVFNDSSYGTASIVKHQFADGNTRQAIKYVAKQKIGTDKGQYNIYDRYYTDGGQPAGHLVPANMTFTISQ